MNYLIKIATISFLSLGCAAVNASDDRIEVKFTFDAKQSADQIYEDLRRQATKTCKKDSAAMKVHRSYSRTCINGLLQSATEIIGRGDIALAHNRQMARLSVNRQFVALIPKQAGLPEQ